jgi:predicted oxidoreductase
MSLPLVVEKLETIPEAARGAYVEKDGKFVLDAEIEDTSGLKNKNAELIGTNRKLAARAAVLGDRTPEDVQADLVLAAKFKEDKAKAEGNFETLKKEMADKSAAALAAKDKELLARDAEVYDLVGKQAAIEAINGAGGKVKKLLDPVMKFVKVVRGDDGKAKAVVVDGKGNARITDGVGTEMTIVQLVEEFKADEDYGNDFVASGASGSGARNEGGSGGRGALVIIPKDATTQEYRRLKDDAEKRGVPYRVAS